jgi:hypothetical protein
MKREVLLSLFLLSSAIEVSASSQCPKFLTEWEAASKQPVVSGQTYQGAVMPGEAAVVLLCPCSRSSLGLGDGYFTPSSDEMCNWKDSSQIFCVPMIPRATKSSTRHYQNYFGSISVY